jgi:predicted MFS family arabinose efflux permease
MPDQVPSGPTSAAQEWRRYWPLVAAGLAGLTVGSIPSATLGLFMEPLGRAFGWSRTQISLGLLIFAFVSLPLTPFAGALADRFGPRRVAIPGVALSMACFAAFSLMSGAFAQWVLLWIVYALFSVMTRTLVWNNAIAAAFVKGRGLAIAVMLCGTALAQAVGPSLARWLIDTWGWRTGYLGLGLGWGGFVLLVVLLFFRDVRPFRAQAPAAAPARLADGLTLSEALRSRTLQRMAFAIFVQSIMGTAMIVHLVPLLVSGGLPRSEAAGLAGLYGIAAIVGKLASGWLFDRFPGNALLPVLGFGGPALAYLVMSEASGAAWLAALATLLLGYCSGAALQAQTYLITRYAGLRNLGAIYGGFSSLMALAVGIGPVIAGRVYDLSGNYAALLLAGIPISLAAGLAMFRLGPFPTFAPRGAEATLTAAPAS